MSKDMYFIWGSFPISSEEYTTRAKYGNLVIGYAHTEKGLPQIFEAVKRIKSFGDTEVTLEDAYSHIRITGLMSPIYLAECCMYLGDPSYTCEIPGTLPSLQWFLDHKEEVEDTRSSKVFYVEDIALQIVPEGGAVSITVLDTKNLHTFIDNTEGERIEWLDGTFEEFLESYGYKGRTVHKTASLILTLLQVAMELGFKHPEELATHFGDKRLIADLKLKGVLEHARVRLLR